jgi:hypothetical protein
MKSQNVQFNFWLLPRLNQANKEASCMKLHRNVSRFFYLPVTLTLLASLCLAPCASGQSYESELPRAKQTSLGLYVTAREAYDQ